MPEIWDTVHFYTSYNGDRKKHTGIVKSNQYGMLFVGEYELRKVIIIK